MGDMLYVLAALGTLAFIVGVSVYIAFAVGLIVDLIKHFWMDR
jgi:preprotein translocase subunit Sec61beta